MHEETVREIVVIEAEDLDYVREAAAEQGVELQELPRQGFEPITTLTLLITGSVLAVGALSSLIERHKGGQVIDLRSGAPKPLYRDKGVVYGLVIVLANDGTVTVEVKQPKEMFDQVVEVLGKTLLGLGKASIDTIAGAASVAVGDKASVKTDKP